jgi:predicted lipid-binding transport protein (Tim44 family)
LTLGRSAPEQDAAESAFRAKRLAWSAPAGLMGGVLGGMRLGGLLGATMGAVAAVAAVYVISGVLSGWSARGARAVLLPSGRSTPSRHEFSQAEAAIMRRRYAEAAVLLEAASMDDPGNPEAYLRLARLHRDHLDDPWRAHAWFQHARATGRLTPGERRRVEDEVQALRVRLHDVLPEPG